MVHKLSISCSKHNLAHVRSFVGDVLLKNQVNEMDTYKLVLAVDEVCANLIIHSNQCDCRNCIEIQVEVEPKEWVIFSIRDHGVFFDFSTYKEPNLEEVIRSKKKGGMGLLLVKRIMDKIEFATEKNCNLCRLTKRFSS